MSSINSTKKTDEAFILRLKELFGTDEPAVIQRKLGVNYQSAKNYLLGRKPNAEVLEKIVEVTDVSLNWLLMGQEPKFLRAEFDVEAAVAAHDDWFPVMTEWYEFENRPMPDSSAGVSFMGGWKLLATRTEKVQAIRDLKTLWDLAKLRTDDGVYDVDDD